MFAKFLEDTLTSANPEKSLPGNIHTRIEIAVSIRDAAVVSRRVDLDKQGTRLWNLSSKLKKTAADEGMLCLGRVSHSQRFCLCLRKQFASLLFFFST